MFNGTVTGRIGRISDVKQANDKLVCNFSVASSKKVNGQDTTVWVKVSAWGKQAEYVADYLAVGQFVSVSGSIGQEEWVDGNNNQRFQITMIANEIAPGPAATANTAPAEPNNRQAASKQEAPKQAAPNQNQYAKKPANSYNNQAQAGTYKKQYAKS